MFALILLFAFQLEAKIIHQYFQKIESNGSHIGYAILQEEHLADKNQMVVTSFVKTNQLGGNIIEGIKAYSDVSQLAPISYQYTLMVGDKNKIIDAVVRKGSLFTTTTENGTKKTTQTKIDENSFFSTFLVPRMLRKGLAVDKNFKFSAIAEEDASVSEGRAQILELTKINGQEAYKLVNDYKNNRFYSYISPEGKVLKTENPITKINTITVDSKKNAVGSIAYPEVVLKTLFGKVP
tara:strand:- start:1868 stop:2578 length:711 start_codon:yes stop_codon:yes gene_type:complete